MWMWIKTLLIISSSNNPNNLPLPVTIHTKSYQLPFNSCWNVHVLYNLPPNTNHITRHTLELAYQFVLSSRHRPGINLMISIQFPPPPLPPLPVSHVLWWHSSVSNRWCRQLEVNTPFVIKIRVFCSVPPMFVIFLYWIFFSQE